MKNRTFILYLCVCLSIGLNGLVSAETQLSPEAKKQIELHLEAVESKYGIAGQSLALLKNSTLIYTSACGLSSIELNVEATDKTVYQSFSLAKLFAVVTLMQLVEAGSVVLDSPIGQYLDELPDSWKMITVRQVISHMSGLPEYYDWPNPTPKTPLAAIKSVADKALEFQTASTNRYNQTNYLILKMIIESITQQDFVSTVTARMINKLQLENTFYGGEYAVIPGRATTYRATPNGIKRNVHVDQPDYMFASSGLNTSALDLARWFAALLNHQLVSADTLQAMWQPVLLADGSASSFANGWEYRQDDEITTVGHGGGNLVDVRHYLQPDSKQAFTVIYMTNGSEKRFWPGTVSLEILNLVSTSLKSAQH